MRGRYQTRLITSYDAKSKTAGVDFPWELLPWQPGPVVFRGSGGSGPPVVVTGSINSTAPDGSFTTTDGTTELLAGRVVTSLESPAGTPVVLPTGTYVRSSTITAGGNNLDLILSGPDGRLVSLGGAVANNAVLVLGARQGSQFEIYSATTTENFSSPLPLHFGTPPGRFRTPGRFQFCFIRRRLLDDFNGEHHQRATKSMFHDLSAQFDFAKRTDPRT